MASFGASMAGDRPGVQVVENELPRSVAAGAASANGGICRLALHGDIDLSVRDLVRQAIEMRLVCDGVSFVLVDLADVTFMDCSTVGVLVACQHLAADIGCGFRVVNANGVVARVLDLAGAQSLLRGWTPQQPQQPAQ